MQAHSAAAAPDRPPHVIKKYANRRLYHTGTSAYVTLEDLAAMVKKGDDFVVNDAKTGEDITHSVLTQIIFEQEGKGGQNLLPVNFLRQMIRFYGDSMQALVPRYLEFSMDRLMQEQQSFREQMSKAFGGFQLGAIEDQVRSNMALFAEAVRVFTPFAPSKDGPKPAPKSQDDRDDEVAMLKRELSAMKARLDKLG